jgi:hypothetical protein
MKIFLLSTLFLAGSCCQAASSLDLSTQERSWELKSACEKIKSEIDDFLKTATNQEKNDLLAFIISKPPHAEIPEMQIMLYDPLRTIKQKITQQAPPTARNQAMMQAFHAYYDCLKKYVESQNITLKEIE